MTEKLINVSKVNFFIIKEVLSELIVKQLINLNRGHTAAAIDGRCWDSNRGSQVLEAIALPAVPHPLPIDCQSWVSNANYKEA